MLILLGSQERINCQGERAKLILMACYFSHMSAKLTYDLRAIHNDEK